MKPQNKVTIFMIVMIVMLSIYYFAMPNTEKPIDDDDDVEEVVKSEEFEQLRQDKKATRQEMIQQLYGIIGTGANPDQVKEALATIDELNSYTQNESMLEAELILAGFVDAYVEVETDDEVRVYLYTTELSASQAIKATDAAKSRFGESVDIILQYNNEVN